jgi:hypothetical protein
MTKKQMKAKLEEKCDLYFDLVWYARKDKTDPNHPGRQDIERIRRECPEQVAALCGESSDWHHGFNSGSLAMVRFALGLMGRAEDAESAEEEFPVLDT